MFSTALMLAALSAAPAGPLTRAAGGDGAPVAREVRIELAAGSVAIGELLGLTEPALQMSPYGRPGFALLRLPSSLSLRVALERLRQHPQVRSAQPSEPQMLDFDRTSVRKMRAAVAAWRSAWGEFYEVAELDEAAPEYQRKRKIPRLGYLESYLDWFDARSYPRDEIDYGIYDRARATQDLMVKDKGAGINKWVYLGPTNLDTPFRNGMGLPPVNGRVNALAYNPQNADVIYAASACGGVWKTTSGGSNWAPFSDDWEELYTSSVAVDPTDPRIVYVGTGDFPGSRGTGIGVMKTMDGGFTWTQLDQSLVDKKRISDVVIDPEEPLRVTISTGRASFTRVYQSTNGGASWDAVVEDFNDWFDLAIGAATTGGLRYYYAACTIAGGDDDDTPQLWRSADRGETWEQLTLPRIGPQRGVGVDTSRVNPLVVYFYAATERRVYRSDDAGETWDDITGDLDQDNLYWGQDFYNFRISCGTDAPMVGPPADRIWIANIDVMRGTPAGSWTIMGGPGYSNNGLVHVDAQGFAQHPTDPKVTLLCNDGGVYRYDGTGMERLSAKLGCMLPNRIDVHPTDLNFLLGGTQDNGTSLCTGNLNAWFTIVAGDTGHVAVNQIAPQIQYAAPASQLGRNGADDVYLWRTDDFWQVGSGSQLVTNVGDDAMRHGTPIAIDPVNTNRVYFASNYLYRYDELTQSWSNRLGNQKLSDEGYVFTMAIAPSDGDYIYTGSNKREIWMTSDAGQNWERIDDLETPDSTVAAISVDPTNPRRILVGYSSSSSDFDKLWECKNTEANPRVWTTPTGSFPSELPNVPINAIARHPDSGKKYWYIGTDIGVFGTANEGGKWFDLTQPFGLPQIEVTDLKVNRAKHLFASTYGRGFWRIKVAPTADAFKIAP